MIYTPSPIDTGDIDLSNDLGSLVERLVKHIHDTWAKRRIGEGRTYGPKRDDGAKTHPCLVPEDHAQYVCTELPDEMRVERVPDASPVAWFEASGYNGLAQVPDDSPDVCPNFWTS